jgi:hypothetical protein
VSSSVLALLDCACVALFIAHDLQRFAAPSVVFCDAERQQIFTSSLRFVPCAEKLKELRNAALKSFEDSKAACLPLVDVIANAELYERLKHDNQFSMEHLRRNHKVCCCRCSCLHC